MMDSKQLALYAQERIFVNTIDQFKNANLSFLRHKINSIDLNPISHIIQNELYRGYFIQEAGSEHYKLLAFLSSLFNDCQLFDIGTHIGGSSIALAYNPNNLVISYDIDNFTELKDPPSNIHFQIGDFRKDDDVLSSPLIFIDAHHNGTDEKEFHQFFLNNNYKGVVLWDDIYLNPEMRDFWGSVTTEKYDLTAVGHGTGTGMIIYSGSK